MLLNSPIYSNIKSLEESTSASAGFHTDPPSILIELKFGVLVFVDEKNPQRMAKTNYKPATHIWHRAGVKTRPHWWEEGALTTAPLSLTVHLTTKLTSSFYKQVSIELPWPIKAIVKNLQTCHELKI